MLTIAEIKQAHAKVKSGADFPAYIREIKTMGVKGYETWVSDGHTEYFGENGCRTSSEPKYDLLTIADVTDKEEFVRRLKAHQQGETGYYTFCKDCAIAGVEKWVVSLDAMSCIYYDKAGKKILEEKIPG